jgi:hypothetical protein
MTGELLKEFHLYKNNYPFSLSSLVNYGGVLIISKPIENPYTYSANKIN